MGTADPDSGPSSSPEGASIDQTASPATPARDAEDPRAPGGRLLIVVALAGGLASGVVAWLLGESGVLEVAPAISQYNMMGTIIRDATPETRHVAAVKTAAWKFGTFGALAGLAMGLVGGLWRRESRATAVAAGLGLVVAGAAGAAAAAALVPILLSENRLLEASELAASFIVHGGIAACVGAGAGLALGVGLAGIGRTASSAARGGALGGLAGAFAYEVLGASFFPLAETSQPIPATVTARVLALVLVATAAAAGSALSARKGAGHRPASGPGS